MLSDRQENNLHILLKKQLTDALLQAFINRKPEFAMSLIEKGADVNCEVILDGVSGSSFLHIATCLRWEKVIAYLIEKGADLNKRDEKKRTFIDLALESKSWLVITTAVCGSESKLAPAELNKILWYVWDLTESPLPSISLEEFKKGKIEWLLAIGASLEESKKNKQELSLLEVAASEKNWPYVSLFLDTLAKRPQSPNIPHLNGVLWWAVSETEHVLAQRVLSLGKHNTVFTHYHPDIERTTILHLAVEKRDKQMMELLLSHLPFPLVLDLDSKKRSAMELAAELKYWDMVACLLTSFNSSRDISNKVLKVDISTKVLINALSDNTPEAISLIDDLLKAGANPNALDKASDTTPFHRAVNLGQSEIIFSMLKAGANIEEVASDQTPYEAIEARDSEELTRKQAAYFEAIDQVTSFHTARKGFYMMCQVTRQINVLPSEMWHLHIAKFICGNAISLVDARHYTDNLPERVKEEAEVRQQEEKLKKERAAEKLKEEEEAREEKLKKQKQTSKERIAAFKIIYSAVYNAELTIFKSASFLADKKEMSDQDLLEAVMRHIEERPNSRSAKVWALAKKYHGMYHHVSLITEVYDYGLAHSGFFSLSRFNREVLKGNGLFYRTKPKIDQFVAENPTSRIATVMDQLQVFHTK